MKKYFSNPNTAKASSEYKKVAPAHSYGRAVPMAGSLEACLCADELTYSKKCCKGFLINQGIGQIQSPYPTYGGERAFSNGFNLGFS
jgi:hypothetical protein